MKPTDTRTADPAPAQGGLATIVRAVWFRWAVVLAAFGAWVGMTLAFPLYFQRDDVQMMDWANHHGLFDGFIPDSGHGLSVDSAYRPLVYAYWKIAYSLFGMCFEAHYLMTGVLFIASLAFLFKLTEKFADESSAWLSVLVWPVAFRFLLTLLFWLTDQMYLVIMIMVLAGMYLFISGLGTSRLRIALGSVLLLASFLAWEPPTLVLGTALALYLLTHARELHWGRWKALGYALLCFSIGPAYLLILPFGRQRVAGSGGSLLPTLPEVMDRLAYYGSLLTSGSTGLILLIPAAYYILSRLLLRRSKTAWATPSALILAAAISLAVGKYGLYPVGLTVVVLAGFALPRTTYVLLPVAFVPLAGLMVFSEPSRTYLFMPAYALSVMAALQAREMGLSVCAWWNRVVRQRALGIAVLIAMAAGVGMLVIRMAGPQISLLRLRSDVTLNVKSITHALKRLPTGATVVVVDYPSMGVNFGRDLVHWTDREKLLYQAPIDSRKARYWFRDIGRRDLRATTYTEYAANPSRSGRVYLWLQTAKDHDFIAAQGIDASVVATVQHGEARSTIARLR